MFRAAVFSALLAVAGPLHAQPTKSQLQELYSRIDDAVGLRPGMTIADIGTGYAVDHALAMAQKVAPGGKVYCVDVKNSVLTKIRDQARDLKFDNIEAVLGSDDDPKLPERAFDAILVSNTYHEFTQPVAMLKRLCAALKPGGKMIFVENCSTAHRGDDRAAQTKLHDLAPEILERELVAAGLVITKRIDPIMAESADRFRYLFVAEKG